VVGLLQRRSTCDRVPVTRISRGPRRGLGRRFGLGPTSANRVSASTIARRSRSSWVPSRVRGPLSRGRSRKSADQDGKSADHRARKAVPTATPTSHPPKSSRDALRGVGLFTASGSHRRSRLFHVEQHSRRRVRSASRAGEKTPGARPSGRAASRPRSGNGFGPGAFSFFGHTVDQTAGDRLNLSCGRLLAIGATRPSSITSGPAPAAG